MRKIVLFVAALLFMAVPVMAVSNVAITCTADQNEVTVSYAVTGSANLIRAFGLDITVVGANITKIDTLDPNYRIYPGQIVIEDGNVTDYNTPYAPGDLGDANVTIEMGSLYTTDSNYAGDPNAGYDMIPEQSGTLLKFYTSGNCTYAVTKNAARGGVVMEDPAEEPNVTLCSGEVVVGCYVPNVVGMLKAAADAAIDACDLVSGGGTGVPSCEPLNEVLTQDPCGGMLVECGSTVNYTYSLYQTTVPDVVNEPNLTAQADIIAAGLAVGDITTAYDCAIPADNVISTTPIGESTVSCGSEVDMVVSLGPPAAAGAATNPNPAIDTKCVLLAKVLSWTVGANTVTQDVRFGTTNPPPIVAAGVPSTQTTYDPPGNMVVYTKYYWRIDEKNVCGQVTTGTVWCFVTGPQDAYTLRCCLNEASPCLGNVNGDTRVNSTDISALLTFVQGLPSPYRCNTVAGQPSTCPTCSDINGDGRVNSTDISALLALVQSWPSPYRQNCPWPKCP